MNVLLACPLWGYFGGREQYLADTVEELSLRGHECTVICSEHTGRPIRSGAAARVKVYRLAALNRFASGGKGDSSNALESVLERVRPDAMFVHDIKNGALLRRMMRSGGVVSMAHFPWLFCLRDNRTEYLSRRACTRRLGIGCLARGCFLGKPDGTSRWPLRYNSLPALRDLGTVYAGIGTHVVASRYMRDVFLAHGFREDRVRVVGLYTGLPPLSPQSGAHDGVPVFLYLGRVDRYKGLDFLIRALVRCTVPLRLEVLGEGPLLGKCSALARSFGLGDRVVFHGWVPRDRTGEHLASARAVVVPSVCPEAFGMAGLESQAAGKPVIAFDSGGISDWLVDEETGYLVRAGDVDALARRMDMLAVHPEPARRMGLAGRARAEKYFTRERHFGSIENILSEAEAARGRGEHDHRGGLIRADGPDAGTERYGSPSGKDAAVHPGAA